MSIHERVVIVNEDNPNQSREVCGFCTMLVAGKKYISWPCLTAEEQIQEHNKLSEFLEREIAFCDELFMVLKTSETISLQIGRKEGYRRVQEFLEEKK